MRRLHKAVADQLGVEPLVDTNKSMKGEFRPAQYEYPGQVLLEGEAPGTIRVELSSWGGSIPSDVKTLRSLIAEHAGATGLSHSYEENELFDIRVLRPERTLVEKLVILHDAATRGEHRQRKTARHYYDLWCLLDRPELRTLLAGRGTPRWPTRCTNTTAPPRAAQGNDARSAGSPPALHSRGLAPQRHATSTPAA